MATYRPEMLVYAAYARCGCGAGLAYAPRLMDYWHCSAVLTGRGGEKHHDEPRPFHAWAILPERHPAAKGATTRPKGEQP